MLIQFAVALGLVFVCVALHVAVLAGLMQRQLAGPSPAGFGFWATLRPLFYIFVAMMASHVAQTVLWAGFYRAVGAFADLESALYYSITCYSSLGFGDLLAPQPWRLLGPIEAVTGILMFGWSTGYLVAFFTRIYRDNERVAR